MKITIYIVSICALILSLFSCEDAIDIVGPRYEFPEDADIKPLRVGNTWEYYITYFSDGEASETDSIVHTIVEELNVGGENWYVEDQGYTNPRITLTITNRSDGLWSNHGTMEFSEDEPYKLVEYPARSKTEYIVGRFTLSGETYEIYRNSEEVKDYIEVPAGRFRCIKYNDRLVTTDGQTVQDPLNILYYSPNYGMVKRERFKTNNFGALIISELWELKEYKIYPEE